MSWLVNLDSNIKILISVISNIVILLGFILGVYKKYKILKKSQLRDIKIDLANKFFIYDKLEEVEDYLVIGFREKCEDYFKLGGDSYIHPMYDKSFKWNIKQTEYLK